MGAVADGSIGRLLAISGSAALLVILQDRVSCSGSMTYGEGLIEVLYEKTFESNSCFLFWRGWTNPSVYTTSLAVGIAAAGIYYFRRPLLRTVQAFLAKGDL